MIVKVNLLPENLRKRRTTGRGWLLAAFFLGVLIILALVQSYLTMVKDIALTKEAVNVAKNELGQYAAVLAKKKELDELTKTVTAKRVSLGQNAVAGWGPFLQGLAQRVPPPVILNEISSTEKGDVLIRGRTETLAGLAGLLEGLQGSGFLDDLAVSWVTAEATARGFSFEITARRHGLPKAANPPSNGNQTPVKPNGS